MDTYCLSCKKDTRNINPKVIKTKNYRKIKNEIRNNIKDEIRNLLFSM